MGRLPAAGREAAVPAAAEALDALSRIEDGALLAGALAAIPPYARGEGNPFFTEQLVATAMAGDGVGALPAGWPGC